MTNLIAKVREMQEVGDFVATTAEMNQLLAALGKVQAGDADEIDYAIDIVSQHENDDDTITCLRRYADLARLMEDEYAT